MVCGDHCSKSIQGWSTDDSIISRGLVNQQEVNHLSDFGWMDTKSYWQLNGSFGVNPFSAKPVKRGLDGMCFGTSHIHLAEGGGEQYVHRASNVN